MSEDRLFSPGTAGLLVAMTALQRAGGVEPGEAFRRAVDAWEQHVATHGHDLWPPVELEALVTRLTPA